MNETGTLKAVAAAPVAAAESPPVGGAASPPKAASEFEWSPKDFETVPHSKIHRLRCREVEDALESWLEGREAYVGGDQNVYYDEHDLDRVVAPDVFVVLDVSGEPRINYRIWVEGPPPCFVLEVLSPSTRRRDLGEKKAIYERMGVREYFVFEGADDDGRRRGKPLDPPLQGFRLRETRGGGGRRGARYEPISPWRPEEHPSDRIAVGYASDALGLGVVLTHDRDGVRFLDPVSGRILPTAEEARVAEQARADAQEARADAQEARADAQEARAAEDRGARVAAEARVAELERRLAERS